MLTEEIKPHVWTSEEAYRGGQAGYRIGVTLSGNPFKNGDLPLSDRWIEGWNKAQANDPYLLQKKVHYSEDRDYDRKPRPRSSFRGDR